MDVQEKRLEDKQTTGMEREPTDQFEEMLYAAHTEITSFKDLEGQRGTPIPALFNQFYKFIQNPSSVSIETFKRMIDTDDTVGSGMDFLIICLIARLGRYQHPSKEISDWVNRALEMIEGGFQNAGKELLSAVWAGHAVSEKRWKNDDHGFIVDKLVSLPPTTLLYEVERTGGLTPDGILQYQRNYNPFLMGRGISFFTGGGSWGSGFSGDSVRADPFAKLGDLPFPLRTANSFNYLSIRIPTRKCVHFAFDAGGKFGNPYGRSILRRAYKYYVMKDAFLQMMAVALDRKGTALTIVYCDPNTVVVDPTRVAAGDAVRGNRNAGKRADEAARDAFKNVHNDTVIFLPGKKGEIYETEFMPQAPNTSDFIAALDFCNKSLLRAMLVPSLIFGNGDGTGSYSLGQEHAKTFDKILDGMLAPFEEAILNQLVHELIAYNFPRSAWEKDGLGSFGKRELTRDEIDKQMETFEKGVNVGIIDQSDLNDLNKMRDAIDFEQRDTPIEKPMPLGGMFGGAGGGVDPEEEPEDKAKAKPAKKGEKKDEPSKKKK